MTTERQNLWLAVASAALFIAAGVIVGLSIHSAFVALDAMP